MFLRPSTKKTNISSGKLEGKITDNGNISLIDPLRHTSPLRHPTKSYRRCGNAGVARAVVGRPTTSRRRHRRRHHERLLHAVKVRGAAWRRYISALAPSQRRQRGRPEPLERVRRTASAECERSLRKQVSVKRERRLFVGDRVDGA